MRPTRRGRPTGRNDGGGGGGNEEDFEDEQKLSVFDREKVLEFLLRGPHGAGRGRDDDDRDEDGFDGGAHGGGKGGRDDVVDDDDDDDSEKENDGEEKTKTTTSRGGEERFDQRERAEKSGAVLPGDAQGSAETRVRGEISSTSAEP